MAVIVTGFINIMVAEAESGMVNLVYLPSKLGWSGGGTLRVPWEIDSSEFHSWTHGYLGPSP